MRAQDRGSIGAMCRRLALEAPVGTADGAGGQTKTFVTVASLWAQVEWLSGDERWRFGGTEQAGRYRITTRWRANVTAEQRFRDGQRLFAVRAVADPDGSRRRLVCIAEEISP